MTEQDPGSIKVTDKRGFTREGERREEPDTEAVRARTETAPPPPAEGPASSIDFIAFLQSLYVGALMSLGEVENPYTKQYETDLDLARQNIDILVMLGDKTRGNLNPEEQSLLDQGVPQLQLLYVKKIK